MVAVRPCFYRASGRLQKIRRYIELARYAPEGQRGIGVATAMRAAGYGEVTDLRQALAFLNANTFLGVNIETKEAVANLEEILVPGIDFAMIGQTDLTHSYGIPGQYKAKLIIDAEEKAKALCKERGIVYAAVVRQGLPEFKPLIEGGAQLLVYGSVLGFVREAGKQIVETLKPLRK